MSFIIADLTAATEFGWLADESILSTQKKHLDQLRIDRSEPERKRVGAWFIWGGIVLILGIGVFAARYFIQPGAISVTTATVRESAEGVPSTVLNASGYVTARREATVSSKVTGKVAEMLVEEGMKVDERQVLARMGGRAIAWLSIAQGDPTNGSLPFFYFPMPIGIALALILGLITGVFPAIQAMRLQIADAL